MTSTTTTSPSSSEFVISTNPPPSRPPTKSPPSASTATSPPSIMTRSRSASDPAHLPSSLDSEVSENAALEEKLVTLKKGWKAEGRLSGAKGTSVVNSLVTVNGAKTISGGSTVKTAKNASNNVNAEKRGGSSIQMTNGTTSHVAKGTGSRTTTVKSSPAAASARSPILMPKSLPTKPIDQLSSAESKALSSPTVPHLALATLDPTNSNAKPTLLFKSYPLPLLATISPRITKILKSRSTTFLASQNHNDGHNQNHSNKHNNLCNSNPTPTLNVPNPVVPTGLILHTTAPTALSLLLHYTLLASKSGSLTHRTAMQVLSIPLEEYAFYKYTIITAECSYLGYGYLEGVLMRRMERIAGGQVHSNDVGVILANWPGVKDETVKNGSAAQSSRKNSSVKTSSEENSTIASGMSGGSFGWVRETVVQSIATALCEGRLQYKGKYDLLRRVYPEFDREVVECLWELDARVQKRG